MNTSSTTAGWWIVVVAVLLSLVIGGGVVLYFALGPTRPPPQPIANPGQTAPILDVEPLAAVRSSNYLNTAHDVEYVGSQACAECHASEYESYLRTAHSRALAPIDIALEPPDAQWRHAASGRDYHVYRDQDQMWHAESLSLGDGQSPVSQAYPMRYVIGSGNHSRSYLLEVGGLLVESPVTWYTSKQAWDMSPGYDRREHDGFERIADFGCLYCHAGRVTPVNDSRFRVNLHEATIGCESCHGPGSLHVARRLEADEVDGDDLTIVQPEKLARERNEDVCAQCHLRAAATVSLRGRQLHQFRPGLWLSDFRVDYAPAEPDEAMKVVGHVEQMRHSACYQSSSMTCTACHDPHGAPAPENRSAYFRDRCHACHTTSCGLPEAERLQQNADNDCVACHMPRGDTDIPHISFTHHRIGLHDTSAGDELVTAVATLTAIGGDLHLPEPDRHRGLGLAYLEMAEKSRTVAERRQYAAESQRLLQSAYDHGISDAETLAALARLAWQQGDLEQARARAVAAVAQPDGATGAHANALLILGDSHLQDDNPQVAVNVLEQLVRVRRRADDWMLLGLAYADAGQFSQAVQAFGRVLQINPFRADAHEELAGLYQVLNDPAQAREHAEAAKQLQAAMPAGNR